MHHVTTDSPRIDCRQLGTSPADVTRVIQCDVTAKPSVFNVFWIIDDNGTTITDASGVADMWTSSAVRLTSTPHTVAPQCLEHSVSVRGSQGDWPSEWSMAIWQNWGCQNPVTPAPLTRTVTSSVSSRMQKKSHRSPRWSIPANPASA